MAKEAQQATELTTRPSTDLEALNEFNQIILGQREAPPVEIVEDPQEISREIMMQLLSAESDEELQNFGNAVSWRELLGVPVHIKGFRWRPSSFDEGGPVYVVVQGFRTDTGEQVILTTGAANVLAQLSNLAQRGRLGEPDCVWSIEEAEKQTQRGFTPLHLAKRS
jgi:hypothetical protein